jgi:hypothetical protein
LAGKDVGSFNASNAALTATKLAASHTGMCGRAGKDSSPPLKSTKNSPPFSQQADQALSPEANHPFDSHKLNKILPLHLANVVSGPTSILAPALTRAALVLFQGSCNVFALSKVHHPQTEVRAAALWGNARLRLEPHDDAVLSILHIHGLE